MTYATTFSGIAGWELGLNACGWNLRWQCEADPKLRAFLTDRFGVPVYPDICTLVDECPEPVDALIGSPPCQPFSVAGAQRGTGDERHLYPAFIRAVGVLRPRWVLMEQVPAILSLDGGRAFGEYVGGLAALGYDLVWHCIPACAAGAPHRRDRLWIIAHSHGAGLEERGVLPASDGRDDVPFARSASISGSSVADSDGRQRVESTGAICAGRPSFGSSGENVADSFSNGGERWRSISRETQRGRPSCSVAGCGENGPDAASSRLDSGKAGEASPPRDEAWLLELERHGGSFGGYQWLTEPNLGRVAHGIPHRVDRLKGLGNAVVPQIPFLIGQAINAVEGRG